MGVSHRAITLQKDLLAYSEDRIIEQVCRDAGVNISDVLFVNIAVPCETYSRANYANRGRRRKGVKGGHGFNHRKLDAERSPCCERYTGCKYADNAWAHDDLARHVKASIERDWSLGRHYSWGIENPRGDLELRPFMQVGQWSGPLTVRALS